MLQKIFNSCIKIHPYLYSQKLSKHFGENLFQYIFVSKILCVEKCAAFLVHPVLLRIISFGKKIFGTNLFLPERFELRLMIKNACIALKTMRTIWCEEITVIDSNTQHIFM